MLGNQQAGLGTLVPPDIDLDAIDRWIAAQEEKEARRKQNTFVTNPYGYVHPDIATNLSRRIRKRKLIVPAVSTIKKLVAQSEAPSKPPSLADRRRTRFLEVKKTLLPYLDVLLPVEEVLGRRRVHSIISRYVGKQSKPNKRAHHGQGSSTPQRTGSKAQSRTQSGTQRPHSASIISTTSAGLTTLGKEGQANATVGFTLPPPPSTSRPLTGAAATCVASTTRGTVGGTSVGLPETPTTATQQQNTKRLRSTSPVSTMGTVSTLPDVAASSATEEETLGGTGKEATEGPELTVSFLCRRYPGVCQAAGLREDADVVVEPRSPQYILKVIEEVYDAATTYYKDNSPHKIAKAIARVQQRQSETLAEFLTVKGVDLNRALIKVKVPDSSEASNFIKPWVFLPEFFAKHMRREYGPHETQHQVLLGFLSELERCRMDYFEAQVFSDFLRQLLDETALAFLLFMRDCLQSGFGLCLKRIKNRTIDMTQRGCMRPDGLILQRRHRLLTDGTLVPLISEHAAWAATQRLIAYGGANDGVDANITADAFIERLRERAVVYCYPPKTDVSFPTNADPFNGIEVAHFLTIALEEFDKAPDDIVTRVKYDDDGSGLAVLQRLQKTQEMELEIKDQKAALELMGKEREALKLRVMRLEKRQLSLQEDVETGGGMTQVLELGDVKSELIIKRQELFKMEHEEKEAGDKLKALIETQNNTWEDIMQRSRLENSPERRRRSDDSTEGPPPPPSSRPFVIAGLPLPPAKVNANFFRAARIFSLAMERYQGRQVAKAKVDQSFQEGDWHACLEEVRKRSAMKIQRLVRCKLQQQFLVIQARLKAQRLAEIKKAAEEAAQAAEERRRRHEMAQEAIQISRIKDIERRNKREKASVKASERALKLKIAYGIVDRMYDAACDALRRSVLKEWVLVAREFKVERLSLDRALRRSYDVWRDAFLLRKRRLAAATCLQATWRSFAVRRIVRKRIQRVRRNERVATNQVLHRQRRLLWKIVFMWRRDTRITRIVERKWMGVQARLKRQVLDEWLRFTAKRKDAANINARKIQGLVHIRAAKLVVSRMRKEVQAAKAMQRLIRGFNGRRLAKRVHKQRLQEETNAIAVEALGKRWLVRELWWWWQDSRVILHHGKRNIQRRKRRVLRKAMGAWAKEAKSQGAKKKSENERRHSAATLVAAVYRGHATRRSTGHMLKAYHAAVAVQRCWRGYNARSRFQVWRTKHFAALRIQKHWRGHFLRQSLPGFKMADAFAVAKANDVRRLAKYFFKYPGLKDEADDAGCNALHYAAMGGAKRTAKLCLKRGMDANMYNGEGRTALHLAIRSPQAPGRDELTAYLLDHGAWIEAPDYDGRTPLALAAMLGRSVIVHELLERGANVHAVDPGGYKALHHAVANGYYGATNELLTRYADVDERSTEGSTSLHLAVSKGLSDIVTLLMSRGARVDLADALGQTPLHLAAGRADGPLIDVFVTKGASIEARDRMGRTPFITAGDKGHCATLDALEQYGAEINAADLQGDTALHCAASRRDLLATSTLLRMGANPNLRNAAGDLPTHLAAANGDVSVMQQLLEYGGSVRKRNWASKTPIGVARMHAHKPMIDFLSQQFMLKGVNGKEEEEEEDRGQLVAWQGELQALQDEYDKAWDETAQAWYYVHRLTGETSWEPPKVDLQALVALREEGLPDAPALRPRIANSTKADGAELLGKRGYLAALREDNEQVQREVRRDRAATAINRYARRWLARKELQRKRKEWHAARRIQRMLRWARHRRHEAQLKAINNAAACIQSAYRGHRFRTYWRSTYKRYMQQQKSLTFLSTRLPQLLRGWKARKQVALLRARFNGPRRYEEWITLLRECGKPLRRFAVFEEYRCPPRLGGIKFYCNRLTEVCQWEQPIGWIEEDKREYQEAEYFSMYGFSLKQDRAARKIQAQWRCFQNRSFFLYMLKAKRMMQGCEVRYLEDPSRLPSLLNYTLYHHAMTLDYTRAEQLYDKGYQAMSRRGPDVPILLYAYALFLAATSGAPWQRIRNFLGRAEAGVQYQRETLGWKDNRHPFMTAALGFFWQAIVQRPSSDAWLNHALVRQLVFHDLAGAEQAYLRALEFPQLNPRVVDNFRVFLRDYKKSDTSFDEVYRELKQRQAMEEAQRRIAIREGSVEERKRAERAAIKLQALARGFVLRQKLLDGRFFDRLVGMGSRASSSAVGSRQSSGSGKGGWITCTDPQGNVYYYNEELGMSQWECPPELLTPGTTAGSTPPPYLNSELVTWQGGLQWAQDANATALTDPTTQSFALTRAAGAEHRVLMDEGEWEQVTDAQGMPYYYHTGTGECRWNTPPDENALTGASKEWVQTADQHGNTYYYNTLTGESRWESPDMGEGQMVVSHSQDFYHGGGSVSTDDSHSVWDEACDETGNRYFINLATGEAAWELPVGARLTTAETLTNGSVGLTAREGAEGNAWSLEEGTYNTFEAEGDSHLG